MTYDNDIVSASRDFVRRKQQQRNDLLEKRYAVATRDFQQIVEMIINDFNPLRIYQWGSLLNKKHFSEISDIDIAIEGLVDPQKFFNLFSKAMDMTDLPLDIVQLEFIHELQKKLFLKTENLFMKEINPDFAVLIAQGQNTIKILEQNRKIHADFRQKEFIILGKSTYAAMVLSQIFVGFLHMSRNFSVQGLAGIREQFEARTLAQRAVTTNDTANC